jgi:hypothetical protein
MAHPSRPLLIAALAASLFAQAPESPLPPGAGLARTMHLLATSRPDHRRPVRILFYGQSITKQEWWKQVAADLRRRYPYADLEIVNRSIGGFSTQYLKRTIEHDLFPFYPDLVVFHDYGRQDEYEEMIRAIRSRTVAEVALQTDHVANVKPEQQAWHDRHSAGFLRELAAKYGLAWIDQRRQWADYLQRHNLQPQALLTDSVHLNAQGNWLMADIVSRHLVENPALPVPETVRDYRVGTDADWRNGRLTLEFTGNRVELLTATTARQPYTRARILIDGQPPSAFPELYAIERPSDGTGPDWPLLIHVDRGAPLQVEDWFLTVTAVDPDHQSIRFSLRGSRTGPDGEGLSNQPFVSTSGRIRISPEDWHFQRAYSLQKKPLPIGFVSRFRVTPLFTDAYEPPRIDDRTREYLTVVASGLPNAPHRLEIIAETGELPQITAIRVSTPPLK